jgi:hypothetical protein
VIPLPLAKARFGGEFTRFLERSANFPASNHRSPHQSFKSFSRPKLCTLSLVTQIFVASLPIWHSLHIHYWTWNYSTASCSSEDTDRLPIEVLKFPTTTVCKVRMATILLWCSPLPHHGNETSDSLLVVTEYFTSCLEACLLEHIWKFGLAVLHFRLPPRGLG